MALEKTPESRGGKQGILRVEVSRPRRTSSLSLVEPASPQPSVDRLSVSFQDDKRSEGSGPTPIAASAIPEKEEEKDGEAGGLEDEEEYSASANVILERRQDSWKRRGSKRRLSMPFTPPLTGQQGDPGGGGGLQRRRSSVFTLASQGSGISLEEAEKHSLRIHKEVVAQVRYQPWPIRRKLRLVHQAKTYIKLHEGQIQERLAHQKGLSDVIAHLKIVTLHFWNYLAREVTNLASSLLPWESRIKAIESHFGSAVASYFTFHRWLFAVNLKISVAIILLIIVPEVLFANRSPKFSGDRKCLFREELVKSKRFLTLWNFEGVLKHSPIFYGFYNSSGGQSLANRLPLLYFLTGLGLYVYSFVAILRKMALNSRQSKLTEKDEDYIFTWKLFTSWDFMIGNPETATNRTSSIVLGFKEALLEEAERTREDRRNWKLFSIRLMTHLAVGLLLASSVYVVILVVSRSQIAAAGKERDKPTGWWSENEVTIVITLIGMVYPVLFDLIGLLEKYHPRKALRLQLARIMVLNLVNLYAFIIATFSNINSLSNQSCQILPNSTMVDRYKKLDRKMKVDNSSETGLNIPLIGAALLVMSQGEQPSQLLYDPTQIQQPVIGSPPLATQGFVQPGTVGPSTFPLPIERATFQMDPDNFSTTTTTYGYSYNTELSERTNSTEWNATTESFTMSTNSEDYEYTWTENSSTTYSLSSEPTSESISFSTETTSVSSESGMTKTSDAPYSTSTSYPAMNMSSTIDNQENITYSQTEYSEASPLTEVPTTTEISLLGALFPNKQENVKRSVPCLERTKKEGKHEDFSPYARFLRMEERSKVHAQCWETMFGQELVKLTVMDLAMTAISILLVDFVRAVLVRLMNGCWFWDLEKRFPGYGDFKIAENILHLVNNQGMVWMGMFFSPGLPLINSVKLVVLMYMRSWAVLVCNVPHEVVFKASKSNNFYFGLLLTMLFLCVLPVGYALVWIDTSWHCGPFAQYNRIYLLFTSSLKSVTPPALRHALDYVASPGTVIPLLLLLVLVIFYLLSLTSALREANDDLKIQLRRERTEERRKVYQMANKKKRGIEFSETAFSKWCHVINSNISAKTSLDTSLTNKEVRDGEKDDGKEVRRDSDEREKEKDGEDSFRKREDSVVSGWSMENIPEIKISESDSQEEAAAVRSERSGDSASGSKETVVDLGHDDVFISNPAAANSNRGAPLPANASLADVTSLADTPTHESPIAFAKADDASGKNPVADENPSIGLAATSPTSTSKTSSPARSSGERSEDDENDDSIGLDRSYDSLSKSLAEMDRLAAKGNDIDPDHENRKNLAKVLVDGLSRK